MNLKNFLLNLLSCPRAIKIMKAHDPPNLTSQSRWPTCTILGGYFSLFLSFLGVEPTATPPFFPFLCDVPQFFLHFCHPLLLDIKSKKLVF